MKKNTAFKFLGMHPGWTSSAIDELDKRGADASTKKRVVIPGRCRARLRGNPYGDE